MPTLKEHMETETAQKALDKAKLQLMSTPDSAFFTTVCFSLNHKWDNNIQTACTNGLEIRFNTEFFMGLSPQERVFLLLHETMHVAYLHMDRLQTRNPAKFNVAADHVINLMLISRGFKMPKGGLADPKYTDMGTEEVYNLLPEQDPSKVDMDLEECPDGAEVLKNGVQDILVRAAIQSKINEDKIGTIPGEIQIYLDTLLDPKLPWNRILQKYMQSMAKNDYSFRKPNRRFFPKHHLPSLYSESLMDIAIGVDISGSVTDSEFQTFIAETYSILKMMKPKKITLIQFDTEIKSIDVIHSVHELRKVNFIGRGGTRIQPLLDWANDNKPQLLLVFTDGGFRFYPESTTKIQTVWLIHNNSAFTAPIGKVIHYEI